MSKKDKITIIFSFLCFIIATVLVGVFFKKEKHLTPEVESVPVMTAGTVATAGEILSESYVSGDMEKSDIKTYKNVFSFPRLKVKSNIYDGVSTENLKKGVCRYEQTKRIGEDGITVICGHSSMKWDYVFNVLPEMKVGDIFYLWNSDGKKYTYNVTNTFVVNPEDIWILNDNPDLDINVVRLFCCTAGGSQRLVVESNEYDKEALLQEERNIRENNLYSCTDGIKLPSDYLSLLNWYRLDDINKVFKNKLSSEYSSGFGVSFKKGDSK